MESFCLNLVPILYGLNFSQSSSGDPIVLYDEHADRWILTEFADPSNVLIAISDNGDPLGAYSTYNFSTPNFPDYPKYGISPNVLTFTSNEEGPGELHQYFIDLPALYRGDAEVNMQRVRIPGNSFTEAQFYVTTPVDWNGNKQPYDDNPITVILNDSSWEGGSAQDQIEVYSFNINFDQEDSTSVSLTSIITTPFDSYPCSSSGFDFSCIPQRDGAGLDAIPEVIMNIPHLRNFGSFESIVLSFITDVTDGDNLSGIRWVELRRTSADSEWTLFQEGTFAPDDGMDRFMSSIAMDAKGNIGLAYNVSSEDTYVGARFTGRALNDPKGIMTIEEQTIVDGLNTINSGGRLGDYSQMSVSPGGDNSFWWTTEYAGDGSFVSQTRIVAFQINRDTFDLAVREIKNPITGAELSESEMVTASIINSGIETISQFKVELFQNEEVLETKTINQKLEPDSIIDLDFDNGLDLSNIGRHDFGVIVTAELDNNRLNDTLEIEIRHLYPVEVSLSGEVVDGSCDSTSLATLVFQNNGANPIDSILIAIEVNGELNDSIKYIGSISYEQSASLAFDLDGLLIGSNEIRFSMISINGGMEDAVPENNSVTLNAERLPSDNFITLEFTTDEYPEETQWSLFIDGSGTQLASGSYTTASKTFIEQICLPLDSCYIFVVSDDFGDGICCDYGDGGFNIYNNEGQLIVTNDGEFAAITEEQFCASDIACSIEISASVIDASSSEAEDGIILIDVTGGIAPLIYSIDGGATFQDSAVFTGLFPGQYELVVQDTTGSCRAEQTAIVGFSSSVNDRITKVSSAHITPNPTRDVFKIEVRNPSITMHRLRVELVSLSGQLIHHRYLNKYDESFLGTFSLMHQTPGIYLLKIHIGDNVQLEKVVKI